MTVDSLQTSAPSTRTKPACFAANTFDSQDGSITMGDAAMPQSHATNEANARPEVSADEGAVSTIQAGDFLRRLGAYLSASGDIEPDKAVASLLMQAAALWIQTGDTGEDVFATAARRAYGVAQLNITMQRATTGGSR